ncbi:hypothetical protein CEXT_672301 [Caerostris extrusa]|uniref:C2H2-type domain-containing protein n=1 Tax=Caerostris extrusa TaxID=172846 RepID=A0AAV4Q682_CAEEX|nr:hypothetical protein CEXT_672301 [Caerostris extrusa]
MDIHTGRTSNKCTECGKCLSQSSTLLRHVRAFHSGENSNKCTECGKYFANPSSLGGHIRSVHTAENHINVLNVVNAFLAVTICAITSSGCTLTVDSINLRSGINALFSFPNFVRNKFGVKTQHRKLHRNISSFYGRDGYDKSVNEYRLSGGLAEDDYESLQNFGNQHCQSSATLPYSSSGNRDQDIDARKQQMHYEERRSSMNQTYFSWQHRILPNIHQPTYCKVSAATEITFTVWNCEA